MDGMSDRAGHVPPDRRAWGRDLLDADGKYEGRIYWDPDTSLLIEVVDGPLRQELRFAMSRRDAEAVLGMILP